MYLVSNGSQEKFPHNTLTSFQNELPPEMSSHTFETGHWEMALSEIAFHHQFVNAHVPVQETQPAIVLVEKQNRRVKVNEIHNAYKIYLPHTQLTQFELTSYLSNRQKNGTMLKFYYDQNTDSIILRYPFLLTQKHHLWIYPSFAKYLFGKKRYRAFAFPKLKKSLEGYPYFEYDFQHWTKAGTRNVYLKSPVPLKDFMHTKWRPLAHVYCPQLASTLGQDKVLGTVTVPDEYDTTTYAHHEFHHKLFYPLNIQDLKQLELHLKDQYGVHLQLTAGQATVVKVILRKMTPLLPPAEKEYVIRLSSSSSSKSSFKTSLQQALPLKKCKMALASISFPTSFKNGLSEEERTVSFHILDTATAEEKDMTCVLPEVTKNVLELSYAIDHATNLAIVTHESEQTGGLTIAVGEGQKITITMSQKLHYFLGGASTSTDEEIKVELVKDFVYPRPPRYEDHAPKNLFVYCKQIVPSPLAGSMRNILRIVPITQDKYGTYISKEFLHLDYHPLELPSPKDFFFEIRTQSGQYVPFNDEDKNEEVALTLVFIPE